MARKKILIVEDEEQIQELIAFNLTKEGYRAIRAASGEDALKQVRREAPDLILLDLMLPGIDGLEVCRTLKRSPATAAVPIIMLTAKGEETDVVTGLEVGADDYITKPFSPRMLIARIRTALRRKAAALVDDDQAPVRVHEIVIEPGRHEVRVRDRTVRLTATEFRVLHALARRPGWVLSRYQAADLVHGPDHITSDRSIDVHVMRLRKKLGPAGRHIETVRGVGYKFKE